MASYVFHFDWFTATLKHHTTFDDINVFFIFFSFHLKLNLHVFSMVNEKQETGCEIMHDA